jgi:hypothetical protein
MANQGRGRSVITGDNILRRQLIRVGDERFAYRPLDTSVDGIRLVILEPSTTTEGVLQCRLVHVTFGQMPKYEALSYTWGIKDPQNDILLNDKTFPVRRNLRDALLQLRKLDDERVLWIDAICINQDDIPERNQQVRNMPHIYSRAQMVLVWLGIANEFEDICRWKDEEGYEPVSSIRLNDKFGQFLSKMSSVDYWHRVWIVQEIGKARKIRIHYGKIGVDWELFIGTMRLYRQNLSLQGSLPLRLADLMLDKYGNGYKLENLIKTHQKALCEDVRDRIYGFTGLANDTYGRLSMDYGKTPFDVWEDVVRFRNADRTVSQHDILEFAGFARQLLGNHLKGTRENIPVNDDLPIDQEVHIDQEALVVNPKNELVFCPARLWGRVTWVGPTYDEIRGNLRKVDEWIASIRDHVSETYLQSAYEENDLLLQLLEDLDYTDLEMVSPIETKIRYKLDYSDYGDGVNTMMYVKPKAPTLVEEDVVYGWYSEYMTEEKYLFLLDLCSSDDGSNSAALKPFTGIGLASVKVARGDFICCFYQKEKAAVVRKHNEYGETDQFSIIGSAVFPDVRAMATEKMKNTKKAKAKFSILNNTSLKSMETINLYMDIGMVYEWSI